MKTLSVLPYRAGVTMQPNKKKNYNLGFLPAERGLVYVINVQYRIPNHNGLQQVVRDTQETITRTARNSQHFEHCHTATISFSVFEQLP